jgi:hypothetical protein
MSHRYYARAVLDQFLAPINVAYMQSVVGALHYDRAMHEFTIATLANAMHAYTLSIHATPTVFSWVAVQDLNREFYEYTAAQHNYSHFASRPSSTQPTSIAMATGAATLPQYQTELYHEQSSHLEQSELSDGLEQPNYFEPDDEQSQHLTNLYVDYAFSGALPPAAEQMTARDALRAGTRTARGGYDQTPDGLGVGFESQVRKNSTSSARVMVSRLPP